MTINLHLPDNIILKPCITVFGVGGAGGNAVNNMINSNLEGAKFVVANTDAQALEHSAAERRVQLGEVLTRGLGAGASPDVGKAAAEEAMEHILEHLHGSNMVFITAGLGGGTGTGAAPVIAKAARESGILTVGVVTKPFHFEGSHRMKIAELGLQEIQKYVDTLIVIPNQNLFRIANERTTFADAFKMADDVLHAGVRGVTDLMIMPGLINLDFADIRAVMSEMGKAMMGTGEAGGEGRAINAAEAAISNPLLDHSSMKGARGVLINITGGLDMTLFEVDEAANRIREEVDPDANIIFGSTFNPELEGKMRVSVVATGIEAVPGTEPASPRSYSFSQAPAAKPAVAAAAPTPAYVAEEEFEEELPTTSSSHDTSAYSPMILENEVEIDFEEDVRPVNPDVFMAPPPVEPRVSQSNLKTSARRESEDTRTADYQSPYRSVSREREEKPAPKQTLGLFGRMANSVGLRTGSSTAEPTSRHMPRAEDQRAGREAAAEELVKADVLDIPAFLRRKK